MNPLQIQATLALPYAPTLMTTGVFSGSGSDIYIGVAGPKYGQPGSGLQIYSGSQYQGAPGIPGITWSGNVIELSPP
jgi:hypothetical protein